MDGKKRYRLGVKPNCNGLPKGRDAERARWIQRYRASGMGLKEFARRHGLKRGRLHYWVYQSSPPLEARQPEPVPTFQEVRLPIPALGGGSWCAEVGLANGTIVRLARGADVAWAKALIDTLGESCSH